MPEEPEIETGILDERINEKSQRQGDSLLKALALTTALLGVRTAVAALLGGGTGNEALGLKTEDTRLPTPAWQESRRFWLSFGCGHSRD